MTEIQTLSEPWFLREIWSRLFVSDDPFGWPFADRITSGLVFYPTIGYHLTERQYEAMVAAAKSVGDDGFVVSITEGEGDPIQRGEHWWCEYPQYSEYLDLPLALENCVYSRNFPWGIMISHEDHALIGGESNFLAMLRVNYRQWPDDIQKLIETWSTNPNGSWVADVLWKCPRREERADADTSR